jgi:arsenate reductase
MPEKISVLFLCTGNSARSQMAEALLRKYAGDKFDVHSAGLDPLEINPYTIKAMEEIGISLEGHTSKLLTKYMGHRHFAYLITVCAKAEERCPSAFPGVAKRLHWDFDDPAAAEGTEEAVLNKFREIRNQIEIRIKGWLSELGLPLSYE